MGQRVTGTGASMMLFALRKEEKNELIVPWDSSVHAAASS